MTELFAAADITGLSTNVSTMLIAFVGVALLFTAYKFVKRSLSRG